MPRVNPIFLTFQDFLLLEEILETLEDKDEKELKLLAKVRIVVLKMKEIHARKDRAERRRKKL